MTPLETGLLVAGGICAIIVAIIIVIVFFGAYVLSLQPKALMKK